MAEQEPDTSAGEETHTVQDQIFEMVQRSQESIIDASRNFADGAADLVPGNREQVDRLIDNAFDLTERVLQIQRDFAKSVVESVTPPVSARDAERGSRDVGDAD